MARVRGAARERHVAVHDQSVRPVQIFEDSPQLGDLHRHIDGLLGRRRPRRAEHGQKYPYDRESHRLSLCHTSVRLTSAKATVVKKSDTTHYCPMISVMI